MGTLLQDIRYGFRMLRNNPGFSVVVIFILAVGIGATTTMFSVVDALLLRPCPYKDPDTLVWICETDLAKTKKNMASIPNFRDWREQNHVFESIAAANRWGCIVSHADRNEKCSAMSVSDGFFSTLGVEPILGRIFLPEEKEPDGQRAVILSYDYWQRWFAGDPSAIGKTLILDSQAYAIIGILPKSFHWIFRREPGELWVPMYSKNVSEDRRTSRGTDVVGRLKNGIVITQAQAEMDIIANRLAQAYPEKLTDVGVLVVSMAEAYWTMIGWSGNLLTLVVLLSIVGAVLLISCIHVSTLLIVRSAAREKEMAVRAALGADRSRIIRQLTTESALVSSFGGLLGLMLAYWGLNILNVLKGSSIKLIPWFIDLHMSWRLHLFALIISLLTCVLFGVLPVLWTSKIHFGRYLLAGRWSGRGPRFHRIRASLVVADIAIAFMVLIGAGLLVNTYLRILRFDTNFNTENVLSMTVELNEDVPPYSEPGRRSMFLGQVLERIRSLPGVRSAALVNISPVWQGYNGSFFAPEGFTPEQDRMVTRRSTITPDYFRVLEIPLIRGRYFTEQETSTSSPVAIINEAMAMRFWPDQNPLGKYIVQGESKPVVREIVGVVGDVKHYLRYFSSEEFVKSFTSFPDDVVYIPGCKNTLMIRTESNPKHLLKAVHREIQEMDKSVVLCDVTTLDEEVATLFSPQRFNVFFLSGFAALALTLTCIGIYGTVTYAVSRLTRDIGIRMALGATSADVLKTILIQGIKLVLVGIIIGLAGAFALTRVVSSLLHDVSPTDPLTFVCVSFLLAGAASLATYFPARRAAKIDPMEALRYE